MEVNRVRGEHVWRWMEVEVDRVEADEAELQIWRCTGADKDSC